MAVLKFEQARALVVEQVRLHRTLSTPERVALRESEGRVLAEGVFADRDFPPFARSTRDGYAVRSADLGAVPARLRVVGHVKAGSNFAGTVGPGQCVEIMTGAPVPQGADAVLMVEHATAAGEHVEAGRSVAPLENVVPRGGEARQGALLVPQHRRIGYGEVGMMAAVGMQSVLVYPKPRVAILPNGDEVVEVDVSPGPFQIRNSNGYSLQVQVAAAQAEPVSLGIAPDRKDRLREMIEQGLQADLLLLSGGVSVGKYDLVEQVLADLGAEFFFDGVAIQPGRPVVFGRARGKFFFGLPGNPLSTLVTFELFVRGALRLLGGEEEAPLVFLRARLSRDLHRKTGLAAFLPALLEGSGHEPLVSPVEWKGSGDLASLNRANCYLAIPEQAEELRAGEWVSVLPR